MRQDNKSEIELNNLEFSGGIDTGVYVDESVLNLKINKCTFSNYNDSAVKLDNNYIKEQRNATINNCVFENNTGTKGGAVYNHAFLLDVNNSTFTNNNATDSGGRRCKSL